MPLRFGLGLALVLAGAACGQGEDADDPSQAEPLAISDQEDAVCGMLVREQSAPRAQLVHRDGERSFFCSLGDLLVYLSAPSPHGRVEVVFVEVMEAEEDPSSPHTGPHEWRPATDAFYVVGVEREGIMGEPVLAYSSQERAERAAQRYLGRAVGFAELEQWWQTQLE